MQAVRYYHSLKNHCRADLILDQIYISRIHAELSALGNRNYQLTEVGSNPVVKVNGELIPDPVILREGDTFSFRDIDIRILPYRE